MGSAKKHCFFLVHKWEAFKNGSNISSRNASIQLFQCAHYKLGDLMLANNPRLMAKSEQCVSKFMGSVEVIKVAIGVKEHNW